MKRNQQLQSTKFYLKGLAKQIRELKETYKQQQRENNYKKIIFFLRQLEKVKYEYRHQHIAYSIVKKVKVIFTETKLLTDEADKRYQQIEKTVRENNEPNWNYIREISEKYSAVSEMDDEKALCVNS